MPLDSRLVDELGHAYGEHRRAAAGEDEREEELVPRVEPGQDPEGDDAGPGHGQRDSEECAPPRAAVDVGRILRLRRDPVEEALHDPREEADVDSDVGQEQAEVRVEDAQPLGEQVERDHPRDVRDAAEEIDETEPEAGGPALEARQHVAGRDRDREREDRGECGDEGAVEERRLHLRLGQRLGEVGQRELGAPMHVEDAGGRAQRGQHHPRHREDEQERGPGDREREECALPARGHRDTSTA